MGRKRKADGEGEDDDDAGDAPADASAAAASATPGLAGLPGMPNVAKGMPFPSSGGGSTNMPGLMAMMNMMSMMGMSAGNNPAAIPAMRGNPAYALNPQAAGLQPQQPGKGPPTIHPMLLATNPMLVMNLMAQHSAMEACNLLKQPTMPQAAKAPAAPPPVEEEDTSMDPDVQEMCDHFHIEERHCKTLNSIMKKRKETFSADIEKLYNKLEQANNPNGLLVVKMREMVDGSFVGMIRPCADLLAISKKFKLDSPAETKLADILGRYDEVKKKDYLKELEKHLEVAARPSAIVMLMLKKISDGQSLGKVGAPQAGSLAARNQEPKGRERDRDRKERKSRSRSRSRGRR
eukprot:TRINITY_DN24657_c0_g1_i1.p2 TRINITY_DN24657_c0_g1~~TRINITY_DN24657_c0_g1_i1.p2  ORF type:complete len:348 (-),score=74.85 TRINITY_DN24657_c0_g1_i1:265-1308(-)